MEYARAVRHISCQVRLEVAGLSLHQSPSPAKLHWTLGTLLGAQLGAAAGRITKLQRAIRPEIQV